MKILKFIENAIATMITYVLAALLAAVTMIFAAWLLAGAFGF